MTLRRVQLRRSKGWRLPEGAVNVARPTRWGNPHRVADHGEIAVEMYEADLIDGRLPFTVADVRRDLAGHDLACWCNPSAVCHADVLLAIANQDGT